MIDYLIIRNFRFFEITDCRARFVSFKRVDTFGLGVIKQKDAGRRHP